MKTLIKMAMIVSAWATMISSAEATCDAKPTGKYRADLWYDYATKAAMHASDYTQLFSLQARVITQNEPQSLVIMKSDFRKLYFQKSFLAGALGWSTASLAHDSRTNTTDAAYLRFQKATTLTKEADRFIIEMPNLHSSQIVKTAIYRSIMDSSAQIESYVNAMAEVAYLSKSEQMRKQTIDNLVRLTSEMHLGLRALGSEYTIADIESTVLKTIHSIEKKVRKLNSHCM